jgi:hypothetical protein
MTTGRDGRPQPDGPEAARLPAIVSGLVPIATIVATVDLERVLADLERPVGEAATAVVDPHLGAAVVVVDGISAAGDAGSHLALAEPTTEGRLAATLARHGEGACGHYLTFPESSPADALDAFRERAARAGLSLSRVEDGPFGRSVLLTGPVDGPHVIVAERRPVPSRA